MRREEGQEKEKEKKRKKYLSKWIKTMKLIIWNVILESGNTVDTCWIS